MLEQQRQHADESHGGRHFAALRTGQRLGQILQRRRFHLAGGSAASGHVAAHDAAALMQIRHLGTIVRRTVERRVARRFIRDGDLEARAEMRDLRLVQFFLLMGDIAALARFAQAVALDGMSQDQGGQADVLHGCLVGVVYLLWIVAAALQTHELLIAEVRHQVQQFGIFAEEILAEIRAVFGDVGLPLAIHYFDHAFLQQAVGVARQQWIPILAPQHLDHVPAGAAEGGFQFLNDLAVAAHGTVEALQIAIDDEDQVVEFLARAERERPHGFGLVHFAIAEKCPDLARRDRDQAAVFKIAHEARLVDGIDGAQAHGDGGEIPEIGHQPGVRIGGQPRGIAQLMPEVAQVFLGKAPFQERARVDAGRSVALEVDEVAGLVAIVRVKEMIEADFEQRGQGCVSGNVAADAGIVFILAHHHGHSVPAGDAFDAALHGAVAGIRNFIIGPDGVHVRRIELNGEVGARAAGLLGEALQQEGGAIRPLLVQYLFQRFDPFGGFARVQVDNAFSEFLVHGMSLL